MEQLEDALDNAKSEMNCLQAVDQGARTALSLLRDEIEALNAAQGNVEGSRQNRLCCRQQWRQPECGARLRLLKERAWWHARQCCTTEGWAELECALEADVWAGVGSFRLLLGLVWGAGRCQSQSPMDDVLHLSGVLLGDYQREDIDRAGGVL